MQVYQQLKLKKNQSMLKQKAKKAKQEAKKELTN